jgi:hypothetical protein
MRIVLDTTKLVEIFIACDDLTKKLSTYCLENNLSEQSCERLMSESEMMTIVIYYHHSGFRCFKYYYEQIVQKAFKSYFPESYSYCRFVNLMKELNFPLFVLLTACRMSTATAGNYIDATKLVVSHNKRIPTHKTFAGIAKRGKTSTGWFFGFKLHAVINHFGQLVVLEVTPGNVADNNVELLQKLTRHLQGFLFGDAGYITSLTASLQQRGLQLITKLRENMKLQPLTPEEKYYLGHRGLIETVFDCLKNLCNIEHSRHRSVRNFFINLWAGLLAYTFMDRFPSIPTYVHKMNSIKCLDIVLI